MLEKLTIFHFITIEKLEIELNKGFSVITGETGAGKSIILEALEFIFGSRVSKEWLRPNGLAIDISLEIKCTKNLLNFLNDHEISCDGEILLLRRTYTHDGKGKCFACDVAVTSNFLKQIRGKILDITAQHEHVALSDGIFQLELLDEYAGTTKLVHKIDDIYQEHLVAYNEKLEFERFIEGLIAEKHYYLELLAELNKLNPKENEEKDLTDIKRTLKNQEKILGIMQECSNYLSYEHGGIGNVEKTIKTISRSAESFEIFGIQVDKLEKISVELNEILDDIESYGYSIKSDYNLDQVEERLQVLHEMSRKLNCHAYELHLKAEHIQNKILEITAKIENFEINTKRLEQLQDEYWQIDAKLSEQRISAAKTLDHKITETLGKLKLTGAKFNAELLSSANMQPHGSYRVIFKAKINSGFDFKPIAQTASGGELARIMLAIKIVFAEKVELPVMIFDEIDTGISGGVSEAVASSMVELAEKTQVIAISHQPQVAAFAHHHLFVFKASGQTNIKYLDNEQRKKEIARLFSGEEISDEAIKAAEKLMNA